MRAIFLQIIVCLTLFACKKEYSGNGSQTATGLAGKWRMVSVKDNSTNIVTTKPSSITGNVDITFTFSSPVEGIMDGVTPTNSLSAAYTTGNNATLSIPAVGRSKTEETTWGELFLDNITYSTNFTFDNAGKLNINTSTNKTLAFLRR